MSKDYAKKMMSAKRRKPRAEPRFAAIAVSVVAVVCFVSAIVYAAHVYHQAGLFSHPQVTTWLDSAKSVFSHKNNKVVKATKPAAPAAADDIQFDFYTELPNMQVNLPASASAQLKPLAPPVVANKPNPGAPSVTKLAGDIDNSIKAVMAQHATNAEQKPAIQYVVQLGEFKNQVGASQLRLSLLLAGVETQIIKISDHVWRVQQGPWSSQRQAKLAQQKLGRKGFDGEVKEI